MRKKAKSATILIEGVIHEIRVFRTLKVLLDADLARLYGVTTGNLNKAVKRNIERFPPDFMFQLDQTEAENLIFQSGISKKSHGGRRKLPFAFTEQGVAMLSSVLKSPRAVQVNVSIMRAFVKLREVMATNESLARQFAQLEKRVGNHDQEIQEILDAMRELLAPDPDARREIGFHVKSQRT